MCYSMPTVSAYVPKFVSIGLFCRPLAAKTPFFAVFGLRHLVVSPLGSSLKKLSTGAQLQTFLYSSASKSFLCSNVFMVKSGVQSLTFKSVTNKQTDREKTQRFWAPLRRVKSEPHKTWQGDRGPQARSCTSKLFRVLKHSFAARGAEYLGITRHRRLKTPTGP